MDSEERSNTMAHDFKAYFKELYNCIDDQEKSMQILIDEAARRSTLPEYEARSLESIVDEIRQEVLDNAREIAAGMADSGTEEEGPGSEEEEAEYEFEDFDDMLAYVREERKTYTLTELMEERKWLDEFSGYEVDPEVVMVSYWLLKDEEDITRDEMAERILSFYPEEDQEEEN